ncbi:hypothetical protein SRHO_G00266040 [Serrasalmus rhombeus]
MAFDLGKNEGYPTSEHMSNSGLGRGKFFSEVPFTPVSRVGRVDMFSPAFCSTRVLAKPIVQAPSQSLSALPDLNDPALYNLITHIAHQVGQTLMSGQQKQSREEEIEKATPVQGLGANQSITEPHSLNLSGVRLVMQSDVKEPPVFRGDESDRFTVREWEELMENYLRKWGIVLAEQCSEILSKLMGKAKDIVKIALRSNPTLKPTDNPRVIFDVLKRHYGEVKYSCMPLADFYGTVPVSGENPVEYWVRLNKAVDTAEESLRRLGRQIEDPCHEVAMMFVTYCPDPALSAVFKFKAPDKWTASEIQEHLDRYQSELRQQLPAKPKRPSYMKHATAHAECCEPDVVTASNCPVETSLRLDNAVTPVPHADDNCMTALTTSIVFELPSAGAYQETLPKRSS